MGYWNTFVETNIMYLCTNKHKYIPRTIVMIFNLYESWRYIEPCHFPYFEPCLDTMWLMSFHLKKWVFSAKMRQMCGKLKFWQIITFTWKMTNITRWSLFLIPLKLIILMTNEAFKLMQSKWNNGLIIPMYILNILMDTSI
jgi:hypothetical protein